MAKTRWVLPAGTAGDAQWDVVVDEAFPCWEHTRLRVATLVAGAVLSLDESAVDGVEYAVLPLSGSLTVDGRDGTGRRFEAQLAGRADVFSGPSDFCYLPAGSSLRMSSAGGCRVALAGAAVQGRERDLPFRYVPAREVAVELRGAGTASREVRNFGTPPLLAADALIACEVLTPAGNWSSWPPHKHDEERVGTESALEEIYYFQLRGAQSAPDFAKPVGYQRVYCSDERPIDVLAQVADGDVVLVPYGWHGPAMAPPGYDMYYLNVMAGAGPRQWLITDDPCHGWVREQWASQQMDPRLPFGDKAAR